MPKIISSQEAKKLFLSDDFPQKGYFVIEMKRRPHARILELEDHMRKTKKERQDLNNSKETHPTMNLSQKVKNNLKELIL